MAPPEAAGDGETCALCGLPGATVENDAGERFCCTGCREVAASLGDVEDIDEEAVREAAEGEPESLGDRPPEGRERAFLRVDGMHCTTCEAFIEALADERDGVSGADASYVTETVRVDYDPDRLTEDDLADALSQSGYSAGPREESDGRPPDPGFPWRLAVGAMLAMHIMLPYLVYIYPVHFTAVYPEWMLAIVRSQLESGWYLFVVIALFSGIVLLYTGRPLLRGAWVSLRAGRPNMDLLVSLAAVGAYLYSTVTVLTGGIDVYYDVTVAIVLVVTAGAYYESRVKREATDLLSELATAQVDEAARHEDDGSTTAVPVADLEPGDRVLVREGERVPVDGTVHEGSCTVDEAVVTGESLPVVKDAGDPVVGGSVVVGDAVVVEVGADAASSLDRIVDLVWNLQSTDRGVQRLANRLAVVFVPTVVGLSLLAAAVHLTLGSGLTGAVLVGLTVLIVSCPCALGLATPLAVASGIREAMERGVVVFDDTVFERLRDVDVVVFDKTGTLTTGQMTVREADTPDDLLAAAALLENRSSHPAAAAIAAAFGPGERGAGREANPGGPDAAADGGVVESGGEPSADARDETGEAPTVTEFRSHATGVGGVVDGTDVLVGHPDLFAERDWTVPGRVAGRVETAREDGHLPVVVGRDGQAEGVVVVGDQPREGWAETVAGLADRGVEVVVLTGDDERAAEPYRDHEGVEAVFAGVPPEGKAETVRRLGDGRTVAMVGDGTNDAPALARADLGVALGGGTALAADAADVAVVDDDLAAVDTVFDLAGAAGDRVKQNIGWAFGYNAVVIPLAVLGHLNPLFAAVAMAASSALVVTNSARDML